jgi:hypothetical protein
MANGVLQFSKVKPFLNEQLQASRLFFQQIRERLRSCSDYVIRLESFESQEAVNPAYKVSESDLEMCVSVYPHSHSH